MKRRIKKFIEDLWRVSLVLLVFQWFVAWNVSFWWEWGKGDRFVYAMFALITAGAIALLRYEHEDE